MKNYSILLSNLMVFVLYSCSSPDEHEYYSSDESVEYKRESLLGSIQYAISLKNNKNEEVRYHIISDERDNITLICDDNKNKSSALFYKENDTAIDGYINQSIVEFETIYRMENNDGFCREYQLRDSYSAIKTFNVCQSFDEYLLSLDRLVVYVIENGNFRDGVSSENCVLFSKLNFNEL